MPLHQKPKAKAAPKKATATKAPPKAAPKKMVQSTLKVKAPSKKRAKPDSDDEDSIADDASIQDDSIMSNTPPSAKKQKKAPAVKKSSGKPLQPIENENETMDLDGPSETKPKKSGGDQYQKLTQLEHILKRPDTYVGSVERTEQQMWVFNSATEQMELRKVNFVPGLYKIFDEILVNAADNKQRDSSMNAIKVTVDREKGEISVENNGRGIPIEMHSVSCMTFPELASTNIAAEGKNLHS